MQYLSVSSSYCFNFSDKLYGVKEKVLKQSLTNNHLSAHSFPLLIFNYIFFLL